MTDKKPPQRQSKKNTSSPLANPPPVGIAAVALQIGPALGALIARFSRLLSRSEGRPAVAPAQPNRPGTHRHEVEPAESRPDFEKMKADVIEKHRSRTPTMQERKQGLYHD